MAQPSLPSAKLDGARLDARTLEGFDAQQLRGQSGTIAAVVHALLKAGVEIGENGSIIPTKGKTR
jgi:hypothetical protein